jgi:hypothetical protein
MEEVSCCHRGGYFIPDPRQKHPRYCGKLGCPHARKAAWQRKKIRGDPDYLANQKRCWQDWCKVHPDYWKTYRQKHPDQAKRKILPDRILIAKNRFFCPSDVCYL